MSGVWVAQNARGIAGGLVLSSGCYRKPLAPLDLTLSSSKCSRAGDETGGPAGVMAGGLTGGRAGGAAGGLAGGGGDGCRRWLCRRWFN